MMHMMLAVVPTKTTSGSTILAEDRFKRPSKWNADQIRTAWRKGAAPVTGHEDDENMGRDQAG